MIESFRQIINRLKKMPRRRICVAAGEEEVLHTVREAMDEGIADAVLVGNREHIWRMACKVGLNLNMVEIIHDPDPEGAVYTAISTVAGGGADVLLEGTTNSVNFLQALASPGGLGQGRLLSYITACEVPGFDRLIYITDGGINASPVFEDKVEILKNAVHFLHSLDIEAPRVAVLSANEKVTPKMPVTVEAQRLADLYHSGALTGALVEGPVALDVAINKRAARQKGIEDPVASNADLLLVPGMEAGNLMVRAIVHLARGRIASVVLGANRPVVLAGKKENPREIIHSLALACFSLG